MQPKLIVASGKSAGRAISIRRSPLLIGRAEDCDVRPLSEDVSRRHCAIHVGPADAWAEDLNSRNGTFVNGVRITEKTRLSDGDVVRVGSLELKVSCGKPVQDGAEDDVSKWLMADDAPAGMFDTTQTLPLAAGSPAADSAAVDASDIHAGPPADAAGSGASQSGISSKSSSSIAIQAVKESQSKPGMLPAAAKKSADSSRDAAAEALRKFFNNR
ncbi:MAG: FHA domain-containing protein [Planctomycetia bacterium]|nr:FHA domain-containing protein [Planctomycetia bacterium]